MVLLSSSVTSSVQRVDGHAAQPVAKLTSVTLWHRRNLSRGAARNAAYLQVKTLSIACIKRPLEERKQALRSLAISNLVFRELVCFAGCSRLWVTLVLVHLGSKGFLRG